jgi:hypothetical protein
MLYIIADMNTMKSVLGLESKIDKVRQALLALGPMHPGSVSRQYQVCGRTGCRCLHPEHPHRHGPYHKLAYVHRGKPVCRFVRADCVEALLKRLAAYKRFRTLMDRWIELCILRGQVEFFGLPATTETHRAPRIPARTSQTKNRRV